MRKIDDTKKNIGVARLNENERKKLFEDLIGAGGKVINDPQTNTRPVRRGTIDREKQKEYKRRIDEQRRNMKPASVKKDIKKSAPQPNPYDTPAIGFFSNLKLNLRLRFLKICQPDYFSFHHKFIENLYGAYRTSLLEAKLQYYDIFKKNIAENKKIIAQLDSQNPIFFRLIETMGEINDIPETNLNIAEMNIAELQQPLMETFKILSLLYSYENTLLNAYFKAISLCRNRDTQRYPNPQAQKKMIKKSLYTIFDKFYPRLHWLMCYYYKCYIRLGDIKAIEELLGTSINIGPFEKTISTPAPVVERITEIRKIEKHPETAEETEQHQKQPLSTIPDEVRKGLKIMDEYNYDDLRKEFDPKGNFESIKNNDKAFATFLIFNEFVKEFSFILNTNKIKFVSTMGQINHQSNLKDLYYEINKPEDFLKKYSASSITYNQAKREKPLNSSQYISYTKRLQEIATKCDIDGRNVRIQIREYMEKLADEMKILLDDMDDEQTIIQNPQEILKMDIAIEGKRKLNGKKVFEAISLCYYFASAFVYRLNSKGDLSGDLEFSDEELAAAAKNKDTGGAENNTTFEDDAAKETGKSILDEFDNFEEEKFKDFK